MGVALIAGFAVLGLAGWTLAMIWFILPARMADLRRQLDDLERRRTTEDLRGRQLDALSRRVAELEAALGGREFPARLAPAAPAADIQPAVAERPSPAEPAAAAPRPAPGAPPAGVVPERFRPPAPAVHAPAPAPSSAWELVIGANWLNRIGVVAIVIGIALGVGYTVGHTGPLGRVAIGYAASLALLAAGVWLERRPLYRSYAYGLVAGGWAGIYFTTYAAHAVESARVIESDALGTAALVLVASGMVTHSLRYRSQTVTGFAYVIAYATLALTPLAGFALVATIPLSVSLLAVAQRFAWPHMSSLGVAFTYGVFALRGAALPGNGDAGSLAPYLALAAYWITFEAGDIAALRGRPAATAGAPLFALNALGFIGAALIQLPVGDPSRLSNLLAGTAAAYLASGIVRAKLLGRRLAEDAPVQEAFAGASQGAIGAAAGLTMWAAALRFSGSREVIALLLTAEMLFTAGVGFGDRIVRWFGAVAAGITALRALALVAASAPVSGGTRSLHDWVPAVALVALALFVNREVLRARRIDPARIEWLYSPAASLLTVQVLLAETASPYQGLALTIAAALLIETGVRRAAEYRYEGYVIGLIAVAVMLDRQLTGLDAETLAAEAWRTLPFVAAIAYGAAARLGRPGRAQADARDMRPAAGAAAWAGTIAVFVLEGRVAPSVEVAPVWAGTALLLVIAGVWRRLPVFVWQAYPLALVAVLRTMGSIVMAPARGAETRAVAWASVVTGLLFAVGVIGRRSLAGRAGPAADAENAVRILVLVMAPLSVLLLIFREVQPTGITLALGLAGALLVGAGLPLGERALRLSGLAMFGLAILRLFASDLVRLQGLTRIVSFIVSGVVLLGVSWVYTRFREEIRKYL